MAVHNKIPITNIKDVDVRDTLNANGGRATSEWSKLCGAQAKCKIEARYKPVAYPAHVVQSHDPNGDNYVKDWWRAEIQGDTYRSGRCGIDFPTYTTTASMHGATPTALWVHDYPDGGEAQPYRITDYAGYNPKARDFIQQARRNPQTGGLVLLGQANIGNVSVLFNDNRNTDALDYTEIGYRASYTQYLDKLYYGLVVIAEDNSWHGVISHQHTMRELNDITEGDYAATTDHYVFLMLDDGLFFDGNTSKSGKFLIYPVLFFGKQTTRSSVSPIEVSDGYIPLPCKPLNIETALVAQMFQLSDLSASVNGGSAGYMKVRFKFTNKWENNIALSPHMNGKFTIKAFPYKGSITDYPDHEYREEVIQTYYECDGNSSIWIEYQTTINVERGELVDMIVIFDFGGFMTSVGNAFIDPFV